MNEKLEEVFKQLKEINDKIDNIYGETNIQFFIQVMLTLMSVGLALISVSIIFESLFLIIGGFMIFLITSAISIFTIFFRKKFRRRMKSLNN